MGKKQKKARVASIALIGFSATGERRV